jgi:catechol 2,3-dioxygenase-like lactoylglutathione lyase family enzyme
MSSSHHHIGVRVSDIDAAQRFYAEALEADVAVPPYLVEGEIAEAIIGVAGASMRMCQLVFDEGFVELFQFLPDELAPPAPVPYTHQGVLHFGLRVDDVPATLAAVKSHGGEAVFEPRRLGEVTFCYCRDPDGNVIELADAPMDRIVTLVGGRERVSNPEGAA